MKHTYRLCVGCTFMGIFLANAAYYILNEARHPLSGVVSMASWILMWLFIADSSPTKLKEGDKLRGGFTMGVALCYLLYHIFIGPLLPEDWLAFVLVFAILFFSGAVCVGLWWAEVSPVE